MYISEEKINVLKRIFSKLAEIQDRRQLRNAIGEELLRLVDADYYASYVWDAASGKFEEREFLNMSADNLSLYEEHFQYRDPITSKLQALQCATSVTAVIDRQAFESTEFFNDFLKRDGLWWGVNAFSVHEGRNLGDMRIWRNRRRPDFEQNDVALIELIRPVFTAALRRCEENSRLSKFTDVSGGVVKLTPREHEIAMKLLTGLHDKEIARQLCISLPTLRTHISRIFDKSGVKDRLDLIARWR